jgi:hypothetical protein
MNRIQSEERRSGQLASVLEDAHDIIFIDYRRTIHSEYFMALLECLNNEIKKKRPKLKRKSAVSLRQSTVSQINQKDGKIVASSSTVCSRYGPQ